MPTIKLLEGSDFSRWNQYVMGHPDATFFHLPQWKAILEKVFDFRTYYMFVEKDGKICGILPLAHTRSLMFGSALVSTPFCVYGGVVADDESTTALLEERAIELARELNTGYLELRNTRYANPDWLCKDIYYTFKKELYPEAEKNLKVIPKRQRAVIRQGMGSNLTARMESNIKQFFPIYAASVRNLGTPVYPRKYFQALLETFADKCKIMTVYTGDQAIGSVLNFYFGDQVLLYYAGGLPVARELKAFDFMYWSLMKHSCENGIRIFDYGRSAIGTGAFNFKKNWGFEPARLYYQHFLVNARHPPDLSPLNKKYDLYVNLWKHLPLFVANRLGPCISKYLG